MNELLHVSITDLGYLTEKAFQLSGELGNDAALFWKIAALRFTDQISEFEFIDVFEAAGQCAAVRKPAYVRQCLRELLKNRIEPVEADDLLNRVRVLPYCPTAADGSSPGHERHLRAKQFAQKAKLKY